MSIERDYFDGVLKYIEQMLMEEDDMQTHKTPMIHESSALQAAEKSFNDALGGNFQISDNSLEDSTGNRSQCSNNNLHVVLHDFVESDKVCDQGDSESVLDHSLLPNVSPSVHKVISSVTPFGVLVSPNKQPCILQNEPLKVLLNDKNVSPLSMETNDDPKVSKGRKNPYQEEGQSNKQRASYSEEPTQFEMYDRVLLYPAWNPGLISEDSKPDTIDLLTKESKGRRPRGKSLGNVTELVDLTSLLTHSVQALATGDIQLANKIIKCIRQYASPTGDSIERLSYYLCNAIEARLGGNGVILYREFTKKRTSAAVVLKAYQAYLAAVPFQRMSNIFANKSIYILAKGAKKLHIIDFGILHGFQWPCIIQGLSSVPGENTKLRITGIDLPNPGFKPAERVEETGRHLAKYCEKFNVPFEFKGIAKKWDDLKLEDLDIEKDEKVVVNCLYRLRNVSDETVEENSPRDKVLHLIKSINPDMFVHGVLNANYNSPFFITRFREALFHFSSLFDMLEATALQEDKHRLIFEQEVLARDVMNVIACEGTARIERPETYKQWKIRNTKAGFMQLPLHKDLMKEVQAKVRLDYHKDFLVDEDSKWMIQGWKGRVLYALSFWKPLQD